LSIFTPAHSTISINPKRWCAYGNEHGTFIVDSFRLIPFNGVFDPQNKEWVALNQKTMGGTEEIRILTGDPTI
jgi:hypothetical protein